MAADNDIKITLTLDADGAVQQFNVVGDALQNTRQQVEGAEGGFSKFQATVVTLQSGLSLVGQAFDAVSGAAASVFSAIEQGSAVDDVANAFDRLSTSAGATSDVFLSRLNAATAETVDNLTLQRSAIEALRAGTKPDEFVELTKAARALAEQIGGETLDELNLLSQAFETGRIRGLQNRLGVIDLEQAERKLAEQLGVTREELSAEGQVVAARTAILEAARKKTEEFGAIQRDAGDKIQTLGKIINDTWSEILKSIAANERLNRALAESINLVATTAARAAPTILRWFDNVAIGLDYLIGDSNITKLARLNKEIEALAKATSKGIGGGSKYGLLDQRLLERDKKRLADLRLEYKALLEETRKVDSATKSMGAGADALGGGTDGLSARADVLSESLIGTRKAAESLKELWQSGEVLGPGDEAGLDEFIRQLEAANRELKLMDDVSRLLDEGKITFGDILAPGGVEKIDELLAEKVTGGQFSVSLATGIGNAMLDAAKLLEGGIGKDEFGQLGAAVGFLIGTAIGAYYGPAGAAAGGAAGGAIGQLIGEFITYFGVTPDSLSTAGRKNADAFFGEMFDANRLGIVVNGQLVKIRDLVFQGDTLFGGQDIEFGVNAFSFLETLPADAQAAFNGVGTAFEELLGIGEDIGGQLAAVFANNVGGSLNNLQLLVQATGKSFEELREHVIEAFLDGKISALEAQTALNGIAQVAQKGIPDGIGLVSQAFDNLKIAGAKGGRASVDALQDIAFEAKELGLKTIPEVIEYLVATGVASREEIEMVFKTLAEQGVDTLEELENAKPEQLIGALSALEAQEFPFKEAVSDVNELIEKIDELPDEIEKKLVFRVETRTDEAGRQALAAASAGNSGEAIN